MQVTVFVIEGKMLCSLPASVCCQYRGCICRVQWSGIHVSAMDIKEVESGVRYVCMGVLIIRTRIRDCRSRMLLA